MKLSRLWLQKFFDPSTDSTPSIDSGQVLPNAEVLADALTFHAFEIERVEKKGSDDILDVKVTPNRGHDALSYQGIAKELSAILKISLAHDTFAESPNLTPVTKEVVVSIENAALCPRYIAGYVKGVKVGPSPSWLVERLEAIGQRSINNIVDATNFIMFNTGQPLHAFDAGKLIVKSGKYAIEIRKAKNGETIHALDGKEYALSDSMLVIVDKNADIPIGIAGVKGGAPAGITEVTRDIIIESANFDGVSIRKTAKDIKLRTDASQRFEQVLSPELAGYGMQSVVELLFEIAGGEVAGFADVYPSPQKQRQVSVSGTKVKQILGANITEKDIADVFTRLGFSFKKDSDIFVVSVPFERLDIALPEDLVEEVGRIIGYDKIPTTPLPPFPKKPEINQTFAASERVREDLMKKGYSEVYTSVFTDTGERAVANKVDSVRPYLRKSLKEGLIDAWARNAPHKDLLGLQEIKLFEIGVVWKDNNEIIMVGIVEGTTTGDVKEKPLAEFIQETTEYETLPLSQTKRYQPFSRFPSITRDIAMWTPEGTKADEIQEVIHREAGNLLVREDLFDEFKKDGKVSYAFRLVFQSFEKTLTDEEVNAIMKKVVATVEGCGWQVR